MNADGGPPKYLLMCFFTDHDEVLPRLERLGYGDFSEFASEVPAGVARVVTLLDPNGFMIELSDRQVAERLMDIGIEMQLEKEVA